MITVNLRHLESHEVRLEGELSVADLDIDLRDEVIRLQRPLKYALEVQRVEGGLLLQGELRLPLECQCVRCLKWFRREVALAPWTCHVPLTGEEAAVVENDCVALTPYVREDILLEFPQHPLCDPNCHGLSEMEIGQVGEAAGLGSSPPSSAVWDELNKLKF